MTVADAGPSGESRYGMAGRPPQNEEGVREVSIALAQALSDATGVEWTADPRPPDGLNIGTITYRHHLRLLFRPRMRLGCGLVPRRDDPPRRDSRLGSDAYKCLR